MPLCDDAPAAATPAPDWPLPPLLQFDPDLAEAERFRCSVEMVGGEVLEGRLLAFEPERGLVRLEATDAGEPRDLDPGQIRLLRLTTPFGPTATAAPPLPGDELEFVLTLLDGSRIEGRTRGLIQQPAGLFLFLLQEDGREVQGCFVPAQQLGSLQLGHAPEPAVEAPPADAAPSEPAAGTTDRAIVSVAELARALSQERSAPMLKLGELLLAGELITPEQLQEALARQQHSHERLGDILVDMGVVPVRAIQKALSEKLGIPFVNLREFPIATAAVALLPASVAIHNQVLPLLRMADRLVVAVENPLSGSQAQDVQFITGMPVTAVIADPDDLRMRIALEYSELDDAPRESRAEHGVRDKPPVGSAPGNASALASQLAQEAPQNERKPPQHEVRRTDNALVRLVNKIVIDAHARGASDIHIESNPGKGVTRIRLRRDGEMEDYLELPAAYRDALVSRIKIMAGLDISEHRHSQDGKIAFAQYGPLPIELRVVVIPISDNLEDVVLRLLGGVEPLPLDKLGLSDHDLAELQQMVTRSYGLILVCGPTGSGKTTTLHSVLRHINRPDLKIWTAEDPVEISQAGLRQVQINARIGWTFAAAMRAFLRADPDVIMVGEMRDAETTKIGIEASLTGHLVFSTIHTNSAAESVVRLLDLGMDPFNFADALIGILSQRLARKLCRHCRKPHVASEQELDELAREYCAGTDLDPATVRAGWQQRQGATGGLMLYEAVGCMHCSGGYRGRIGIYELLTATPRLKSLVAAHATVPQLVEAARAAGMKLLKQDAIEKVLSGVLDLPAARSAAT